MDLEQRVAKLERSVKLWRLAGVVGLLLCVGMGAAFTAQDAEFGIVKARQFQVVDDNGTMQGMFSFDSKIGGANLVAVDVNASQFIIPGPDNRPYARITTIASKTEGKKIGGFVVTDHEKKQQSILLAGRELTIVDIP